MQLGMLAMKRIISIKLATTDNTIYTVLRGPRDILMPKVLYKLIINKHCFPRYLVYSPTIDKHVNVIG
ncbi:hypothetical protein GJV44_00008 [Candidatus Vallotia cooleyia]|nr:hypothetical protein GJV44_00008 [Candidatus Vallotia cooleyia]